MLYKTAEVKLILSIWDFLMKSSVEMTLFRRLAVQLVECNEVLFGVSSSPSLKMIASFKTFVPKEFDMPNWFCKFF